MKAATLYRCQVMHRRLFPTQYRFSYAVFSLLLDIDRIDEVAPRVPLFSHNRFNLLSFHDRDHGARDGSPLRPWLMRQLSAHGVHGVDGRCFIFSMPRLLGYVFNPLSLYYCFDSDGKLCAVVCEVKNTFGEQHCYVLHEQGRAMRFPIVQQRIKTFHVSPFMAIEGRYAFRVSAPGEDLSIGIRHMTEDGVQLVAVQRGHAAPVTLRNLLTEVARTPFMTFKVITMIHWQALRLWLRKLPLHRHRPQSESTQCLP